MLGIKSLLLNGFAAVFFIPAFVFLFLSLAVFMLPAELADLRVEAEERIPEAIAESDTTQELIDSEFPEDMTSEEFSVMMVQFKEQCRIGKVDDGAEGICSEVVSGEIRTKQELKDAYIEKILVPDMREGVGEFFSNLEDNTESLGVLGGLFVALFLVTLIIGCGFLFLNNMLNPFKFGKSVATYVFFFSLLTLLGTFIIWMMIPGMVNGLMDHVKENSEKGVQETQLMTEVLDVTSEISIDWGRGFVQKLMIIFGVLAGVGFLVKKF